MCEKSQGGNMVSLISSRCSWFTPSWQRTIANHSWQSAGVFHSIFPSNKLCALFRFIHWTHVYFVYSHHLTRLNAHPIRFGMGALLASTLGENVLFRRTAQAIACLPIFENCIRLFGEIERTYARTKEGIWNEMPIAPIYEACHTADPVADPTLTERLFARIPKCLFYPFFKVWHVGSNVAPLFGKLLELSSEFLKLRETILFDDDLTCYRTITGLPDNLCETIDAFNNCELITAALESPQKKSTLNFLFQAFGCQTNVETLLESLKTTQRYTAWITSSVRQAANRLENMGRAGVAHLCSQVGVPPPALAIPREDPLHPVRLPVAK